MFWVYKTYEFQENQEKKYYSEYLSKVIFNIYYDAVNVASFRSYVDVFI